MNGLSRKLARDLAKHRAQVAAIVVVVSLGVIMFSGPLLAQRDLRGSIDAIYRRTRYEDFSVRLGPAPRETAAMVEALPNVASTEGRLVRDLQGTVKGRKITVRVISVPDEGRPRVNDLIMDTGTYLRPGETGSCLVEHRLASEFGLEPGDTVSVTGEDGGFPLAVSGTVVSPEYLRLTRGQSEYVTDPAQFGVIFIRYSDAARLFDLDGRVNDIIARVRDRADLSATMKAARALLEPYGVTALTEGGDEPGAATLNLEIEDIGKLALFFAVLLLAVASLALYITMTQIVYSQQREIGVTRALGYRKRTVITHYLGYGAVLGVAGGAVGVAVGYLLSRIFLDIYAGIFELPFVSASLDLRIAAAGVAVGVLFSTAGALVPARHAVRMNPAQAMRVETGLSLRFGRHGRGWGMTERLGLPSWLRVSFRNLVRNRRRVLLTCLGVIGTVCLLVTATGGKDSLDYAVDKYLNRVLLWDAGAVWQADPAPRGSLDRVLAIDGVTAAEPIIDAPALVEFGARSANVQVQAYGSGTVMHGYFPAGGSTARPGPGEVVFNRGLKTRLPLDVGDRVTLSTTLGRLPLRVSGFVSEPFGGVCYVDLDYVQQIAAAATGIPDAYNAVVVKTKPGKAEEVSSRLRTLQGVSLVVTKSGILKVFEELVAAVKTLFVIFYVMAFAMGFAILFTMTTVNLLEREREVATMRTLGAGRARVFTFVTVESVVLVAAALIPGIVLGLLLEWVVISKMLSSDRLAPDAVISGPTILLVIGVTLFVMVVSELPSIRRLWHLDLAGITKERAD